MQDDLCPLVFAARALERSATGSYGKSWYEALFVNYRYQGIITDVDR